MGGIKGRINRTFDERTNGWSKSMNLCRREKRSVALVRDVRTGMSDFGSLSARICVDPETGADARKELIREWIALWSGQTVAVGRDTEVKFNSSIRVDCSTPDGQPTKQPHELCDAGWYRYRWDAHRCCEGDGLNARITFRIHPPRN